MTELSEVRAEGRRLLAEARMQEFGTVAERIDRRHAVTDWMWDHADALLADPAPEGLAEDERRWTAMVREDAQCFDPQPGSSEYAVLCHLFTALDLLDRLSASTEEGTDGE